MEPLYTAVVTAKGGRDGFVESSDGVIRLPLRMPKAMGGTGGEATNPEQLFAAGYAACFDGALNLVARKERVDVETSVTASVTIGKDADGGFALAVKLEVSMPGVEREVAERLVHAAHQVCPYSKATRGNIDVVVNVV
ncbi:organic hydroperoxide resistance protein [Alicyclobacillus kakegawensis]|uniref:organic hydroperoxide resistance protein n=1 Tax=Alicyclobacillus kakegawensis TaxID=392012 RepID=UPI000835BD0A|nr:organic hydroperoxide resistance protein [Alicyclobacillus kakegawensis]